MSTSSRREAVTIALLVGEDKRRPKELLAELDDQLVPGDNVVLLGPAHAPEAPASWRERRRTSLERSGGHRPSLRELVVVLDDRVVPAAGLLAALAAAAERGVGAVGARSNVADGDELLVGLPYAPGEPAARRGHLRAAAARASEAITSAGNLGGPCVLVRRRHPEAAGWLGALRSGTGLQAALSAARAEGLELAVAEGAFVHHLGGALRQHPPAGYPFVSACLIVRDEEHQLAACLESARALADALVVYDTGSKDGTVALARSLGAEVAEGYWDDDFARARNAALEVCRGQWILWLDADEVLVCDDPSALRRRLAATEAGTEGYLVPIDNLQGTEAATALTHPAVRLFRRSGCQWDGRLHEQVVRCHDGSEPRLGLVEGARITHRGYLQSAFRERGKAARNLRSAFGDLAGGSELDRATRVLSLGRSYLLGGRFEEGIELCRRALELAERPATSRLALRALGDAWISLGNGEEALAVAGELRPLSAVPVLADIVEGRARLALGDPAGALVAFGRVGAVTDDDGFEYRPSLVADGRAQALAELGRHGEAADLLLATMREAGGIDTHLGQLVEALEHAGRDLGEIHDALPAERLRAFVPQVVQLQAPAADRILEAWHGRRPGELPVLAAAAEIGSRFEVARQLVWSARLRAAGLPGSCPLVATAACEDVPATDRALAAAVAWASFADERARYAFTPAAAAVPAEERPALRASLALVAPSLVAHLDAIAPTAASPAADDTAVAPAPSAGSAAARRVLVLGRQASALRPQAVARALAAAGHEVTLVHPEPTRSSARALSGSGVAVAGWAEPDPESWQRACCSRIARLYAAAPLDVVVLTAGTAALAAGLAELLPLADLLDDAASPLAVERAEAALPVPALAPDHRAGICVAASLRGTPAAGRLAGAVLAALAERFPGVPLARCGDDPAGLAAGVVPGVLGAGAVADPRGWVAGARALVVVAGTAQDRAEWLALAAAASTPAVVVGTAADLELALERLAAAPGGGSEPAAGRLDSPGRHQTSPPAPAADPLALRAPSPATSERRGGAYARGGRPTVRLASPVGTLDSLAQVNRELARRLSRSTAFEFSVATPEPLPLPPEAAAQLAEVEVRRLTGAPPAAVEIRHQWPPDFRPAAGFLVCIQPFEFGGLPAEWVGPLRDVVDELWLPTSWVARCAVDSGVPEEKVHVVPNGVDCERYRPEGRRLALRTRKATKLLFVGGCIERKGVDVLLEAYLSTFTAVDDVCLVVKPHGSGGVYRTSTLEADVRRAAAGGGAEIEVVDGDLGLEEMAALYRSCDALVHPYRGEGFGLPIAEAMASGLPVVVTDGGAALDFCDDEVAWLVPARKVPLSPTEFTPSAPGAWWLEPSRAALGAALQGVVEQPALARLRGETGRRRISEHFTWDHAARRAAERLEALLARPTPRPHHLPARESPDLTGAPR